MAENLTAAQRAVLFAQGTRQNMHTLGQKTGTAGDAISFTLPKARLLSNTFLHFDWKIVTTAATVTQKTSLMSGIIEKIELNLNNGFTPFSVSGEALERMCATEYSTGKESSKFTSSGGSSSQTFNGSFDLYLRNALNDRDTVSYILLQNDTTYAELTIYLKSNFADLVGATGVSSSSVTVTPTLETFTIPTTGLPDLSVLKLVHSRRQMYQSGRNEIKMSTGTIYRKILFVFPSATELTGNIELVFNQADINYSISPQMLQSISKYRGNDIPTDIANGAKCYVFDFSYQGLLNMGGTRDYIDSEKLTEFSVRFNASTSGTCEIVTETLARLS